MQRKAEERKSGRKIAVFFKSIPAMEWTKELKAEAAAYDERASHYYLAHEHELTGELLTKMAEVENQHVQVRKSNLP